MTESIINQPALLARLKDEMNREMLAAAEPYLQASLKQIERAMRERLAGMVVATLDEQVDMQSDGKIVTIRIGKTGE